MQMSMVSLDILPNGPTDFKEIQVGMYH